MTLNCLDSVEKIKSDGFHLEVIVVDNGSSDESLEEIKKYAKNGQQYKIEILENEENLGFAEGNNVGIRYALENEADYVCLLNNDTRVDQIFLKEMVSVLESQKDIGIVGGKIYFEKGYEFHKDRYKSAELGKIIWYAGGIIDWDNVYATHRGVDEVDHGQYDTDIETNYVNGCLMLVKNEVFKKIGLFNSKYYLYFEDVEFSFRAKNAGFKLYFSPKAKIWHLISGSSGVGSGLNDYFITRNRLLFGMKYAPLRAKLALVMESLKLLGNGREWQRVGIKDYFLGKFGKGSWK